MNIIEQADAYLLQLVATGFSKGDLKLEASNPERSPSPVNGRSSNWSENERFTRREFNAGSFARSFRLPDSVNVDGISAELLNGILQVRIPKADAASPKAREISIG
ncbi:MAG: Hsp20/alpha crystallin family protein [Flavobacteriales bacterium]|nr:Hsp20/alpha crystallin family protein [Flavobacteriales bacterium]